MSFNSIIVLNFLLFTTVVSFQCGTTKVMNPLHFLSNKFPKPQSLSTLNFKTEDKDENITKKSRVLKSTPIKNLVSIETMDDFRSIINERKSDVLVARFFSPWCKVSRFFLTTFYIDFFILSNLTFFPISYQYLGLYIYCSFISSPSSEKPKRNIP